MAAKIIHDCKEELREVDLRATPARLAVLNLLENTDKPLDVFTIIGSLEKQGVNADPVTAFRIINLFTEKGLTKRVQFQEGKFRYELASKEDHHHLICRGCGSIQNIEDRSMKEWENEIEKTKGFLVSNHNLEFFGLCKLCQH